MSKKLIQLNVDEDLKLQAKVICKIIGIDLQMYLRMCLARLVSEKEMPFSVQVTDETKK